MTCSRNRHATYVDYHEGCRCSDAKADYYRYYKQWRHGTATPRMVDSTGAHRRLQALACMGHDAARIARHIGLSTAAVHHLLRRKNVLAGKLALVKKAYADLADVQGTSWRVRQIAADKNWAPPMAWDDDTIDDPNAEPQHTAADTNPIDDMTVELVAERIGKPLRPDDRARAAALTDAELEAVIVQLRDAGHTWTPIAELLGSSPGSVCYWYQRAKQAA